METHAHSVHSVKARNEVNESCHKSRWIDHRGCCHLGVQKTSESYSKPGTNLAYPEHMHETGTAKAPISVWNSPLLTFIYPGVDCGSSEEACLFLGVFGTPVLAVGVRSEDGSAAWNG